MGTKLKVVGSISEILLSSGRDLGVSLKPSVYQAFAGVQLGPQFGKVSSPREAACCFARSRRFSMLVVLLFRLGREEDAWRIGEDHTCWA